MLHAAIGRLGTTRLTVKAGMFLPVPAGCTEVGKSIDVEQLTCQPLARQWFVTIVSKMRAGRPPDQVEVGSKSSQPIQPAKPAQPAAPSYVGVGLGSGRTRPFARTVPAAGGAKRVTWRLARTLPQHQGRSGVGQNLVTWVTLCYPSPIISLVQRSQKNSDKRAYQ